MRKKRVRRVVRWVGFALAVSLVIAAGVVVAFVLDRQSSAIERLATRVAQLEGAVQTAELEIKQARSQEFVPVSPFPKKLRRYRRSFVELRAYLDADHQVYNFGTAGYLGQGYFITVKHNVSPLKDPRTKKPLFKVSELAVRYHDQDFPAQVVDQGTSEGIQGEIDNQDWAIIKAEEPFDLIPLPVNLSAPVTFGDLVVRFGNDYDKGIIATTGYIGSPIEEGILPCLTDGNPGVSGGGVLTQNGDFVGLGLGRLGEGYRLTLILRLRPEMFQKVPFFKTKADQPVPGS
jgi:outer membrane murein-binding lipoprotein Lpp